jgi:hypothetical protein
LVLSQAERARTSLTMTLRQKCVFLFGGNIVKLDQNEKNNRNGSYLLALKTPDLTQHFRRSDQPLIFLSIPKYFFDLLVILEVLSNPHPI